MRCCKCGSAQVEVVNESGRIIFRGNASDAIELIIKHPIEPHIIRWDGVVASKTIDEFMDEWDEKHDL